LKGASVLTAEYIIPFKMRAFCDLTARKEKGERVDSKNIKKHKNDVLKIAQLLAPSQTVFVTDVIKQHMRDFIEAIKDEEINMKSLGLTGITLVETLEVFINVYGLTLKPKAE
jgi:hypothetical protein